MSEPLAPAVILSQAVCDGSFFYGLRSDGSIWFAPLGFPLVWRQLPATPDSQSVQSIGVTFGAVKNLPDEALFAVTQKNGNLYFFNGLAWRQESAS